MPKKKNSGLGRGLDAIFLDNTIEEKESEKNGVSSLRISLIDPKSDQPRKNFDKAALEELDNNYFHGTGILPIPFSSVTRAGKDELWRIINDSISG